MGSTLIRLTEISNCWKKQWRWVRLVMILEIHLIFEEVRPEKNIHNDSSHSFSEDEIPVTKGSPRLTVLESILVRMFYDSYFVCIARVLGVSIGIRIGLTVKRWATISGSQALLGIFDRDLSEPPRLAISPLSLLYFPLLMSISSYQQLGPMETRCSIEAVAGASLSL